jgi:GAF domain-containing protein
MVDASLQRITRRLTASLSKDWSIQSITAELRTQLAVDRVLIYYFYRHWEGQVTFESLSNPGLTILGSTGPDDCFNQDYAGYYEQGRIRAIADLETEPMSECHREFLQNLGVKANLVVPIRNQRGLWGLLIAHHCHSPKQWAAIHSELMTSAAQRIEELPIIQDSEAMGT